MTAHVGVEVNDWTFRELVAVARSITKRSLQEHRQQWADWSLALYYIIRELPNFSSVPRPPRTPDELNPYNAHVPRGIPLKRGSPEAKAALKGAADRARA